ncbi:hypothetical protein BpHYR1_030184, partial [Brachionus plicatilis]
AQDEKRGGWWQPHYVVFYESEEELYYGYIDLRVFVLVLSYEGAAGLTIIHRNFGNTKVKAFSLSKLRMSLGLWFQASLNSSRVRSQIKSARMSGAVYDERPTCFLGEDAVITMPYAGPKHG